MSVVVRLMIAIMAGLAWAVPAWADIPPPPGSRERAAAALISDQGHVCGRVTRLDAAPKADAEALASRGLEGSTAYCDNGKRFLVAFPVRRPGPPQPNAPPPALPLVKPLP
ncbi:MAG: hypothetical protein KIT36_10590 [Alphaproteobacteria bacterium]|nr:hypothetical protein [Alphaproteobacteria bacterium]